jgi:uncharacterized protein YbbC (DUF1343 family)
MTATTPRVETGLDVLAAEGFARLRGRRVGAICNPTSVDGRMRHLADHLHFADGVDLVALFGPEHGVRADAQDMIGVASGTDRRTGVPVHSLYGPDVASLSPSAEQLAGLDCLIFDVQDVGSRYYTFAATMLYAMKAAAAHGLGFLVLDRPNPIGGEAIEGPTIQPGFESFVGAYPMPIRHGMTVGELARLFRAELKLDLDLDVIPCRGWRRSLYWRETGIPWVMPSPNMPTPETALVYPGGCLIEGTNLSEGRGTTRPFELWGAPWLDPDAILDGSNDRRAAFERRNLSPFTGRRTGALLRPCAFRPTFHKHAGQICFGLQPHILDPAEFSPVGCYTGWIAVARATGPEHFAWRTEPYEFVREPIAIDLLFGSSRERLFIEAGRLDPDRDPEEGWIELLDAWRRDEEAFRVRRAPFLLYD